MRPAEDSSPNGWSYAHMWIDDASTDASDAWDYLRATVLSRPNERTTPMEDTTQVTQDVLPFKEGDMVIIRTASHGWGDTGVEPGDIAMVVGNTSNGMYLDVFRSGTSGELKHSNWVCSPSDVRHLHASYTSPELFVEDACLKLYRRQRELERSVKEYESVTNRLKRYTTFDKDVYNVAIQNMKDVSFKDGHIKLITNRCSVTYRYNTPVGRLQRKTDLGFFEVDVDVASMTARFTQRDKTKIYRHYAHPHIARNTPCWGSFHDTFVNLCDTYDVAGIINVVWHFLNHVYSSGWYTHVKHWLTQDQKEELGMLHMCDYCDRDRDRCECDRCSNCEELTDNCDCAYCDHCDAYGEDNCECTRCPDTWDRLQDNTFPDSQCARCSALCRNLDTGLWECHYNGSEYPQFERDLEFFTPPDSPNNRYTTQNERT